MLIYSIKFKFMIKIRVPKKIFFFNKEEGYALVSLFNEIYFLN